MAEPVDVAAAGAPAISVVTASRDRAGALLAKLASLRGQDLQAGSFEWVLCLDGAGDGSRQLLEAELAERPPAFDVIIIENDGPRGPGPARNRAAARARGRVLHFTDDDCTLDPGTLRAHLAAQQESAAYLGVIRFVEGDRIRTWVPRRPRWWNVNGANLSVPREAFQSAGGFPEYLVGYGGEDLALGHALTRSGVAVRALSGAAVSHHSTATGPGGDPARWREAGANAVRLATRRPEMAERLGVAPFQLAIKRVAGPLLGPREVAYNSGALEQLEQRRRALSDSRARDGKERTR